jgi:POLQ-like helicase
VRPESASLRLQGMTHAKSRMYEFNVPEELHVDIRGNDPSHLFPLVIGILGEEAGRIGDMDLTANSSTPRIIPEDAFALRFAAAFLHAYVTSRFGAEMAPELLVLSAAAYYLCDLAGSASVLLHDATASGSAQDHWQEFLRWLIAANWDSDLKFAASMYSEDQTVIVSDVSAYFVSGARRDELLAACTRLRKTAYSAGSARDLLYVDVVVAVIKKRLQNAARHVLPIYSQLSEETWMKTIEKPTFMKELWPSQHIFGERGILQGRSAVVQMPTSAGKTRAIELVIRSAFFAERADLAVVVAPFRALCSEITAFLRNAFRGDDVVLNELSDAMLVDYSTLLDDLLEDDDDGLGFELAPRRQVIVVTPEKLLYVLRHSPELAAAIGLVIYDEGHQFDTGQRGVTYELLLTSLKSLIPKETQIVLISAVIKNAAAIGEWLIAADAVIVDGHDLSMTDRAIAFASWTTALGQLQFVKPEDPNHFDYFVPRIIEALPLQKKSKREKDRFFPESNPRSVALYLGLKAVSNGSVAVFCGTKATACGLADIIAEIYDRGVNLPSPARVSDAAEIKALGDLIAAHFGESESATLAARQGVFSHHSNTPQGIRLAVEYAMKEGLAKFVVCTSTLAQGVNLPIRYLIVSGTMQGSETIKARDFHNLIGRAGRAGMHTEGTIIFSDPKLYDLRYGRDSWRWDAATALLDPSRAEATESSLLEILAAFSNDNGRLTITIDIVPFLSRAVRSPEKAFKSMSRLSKKYEEHKFSEQGLHRQLKKRLKLLEAVESYLMSNRGTEPFSTFLAQTEELAKQTLAYFLATAEKKEQLVALFRMLAEFVEEYQPEIDLQAAYGKTMLGVIDSQKVKDWVTANAAGLVASIQSTDELLKLVWPFVIEVLDEIFSKYLPPAAVLAVVHSWVRGDTFEKIMGVWSDNDGAIRYGEGTRKTKMEDIDELCENAIGYQSTLIVAAIGEMLVALEIDDAEEGVRALGTLQKQLKYGIADPDEIALYELGFADRVVVQVLRPIVSAADGRSMRRRIRNSTVALREELDRFPRYFNICLSSLM